MNTVKESNFNLEEQTSFYRGKVRDVYGIGENILVMVASDRISAFDVVLPRAIPYKGQVLNQLASLFLDATADIVPNWKLASPDPNVTIGYKCEPIKIEMVIRAYLTGHAWREYSIGKRTLCGVPMPDGMKEHDPFPSAIITPATKAEEGHDEDISKKEIIQREIVDASIYEELERITHALFKRGTEMAKKQGLILVDTKYEFGLLDGQIYLIDEIHTPDSSRYFYANGYEERQRKGEGQKQLSKEFVRQWLISNGFQGKEGQVMPEMSDEYIQSVSERYIELFEKVSGNTFEKSVEGPILDRIESNIVRSLNELTINN
ncbi:MAG: phosphoribosylaminoimidazolesuccinocarboxamide synthase [Bacteroidota bacterium]